MPYSEEDGPFFFGREQEQELITANLMGSRLTLLYGASGAGKSSVLRAGVTYRLRRLARREAREDGGLAPEFIVTVFNSWRDAPLEELRKSIHASLVQLKLGSALPPAGREPLAETLRGWLSTTSSSLLVILDQFEEYFLYHPDEDGAGTFAAEFPQAVNASGLRVNFLISMREDSLARLDRFKGLIPGLFENRLRIKRLSFEAARLAIRRPLDEYNLRLSPGRPQVGIEPELVEEILRQVRVGGVALGAGKGVIQGGENESQVETPYLQLVLNRLWKAEQEADSALLRLSTLESLKGAEQIVRAHLEESVAQLGTECRAQAALIFTYLVTPSGAKIAHTARDLAAYTDAPEEVVARILGGLARGEVRILREVAPPGRPAEPRYEIFHDALAPAIMNWRHEQKPAVEEWQRTREAARRTRAERERQKSLEERESAIGGEPVQLATGARVRLDIRLLRGDLTRVKAPVLVVGHYKGVAPVGTTQALDAALDFWISRAHQQKMIGGDLGELFFIPVGAGQVEAGVVLLGGMGAPGLFTQHDLRYLMSVITYAVSTLGLGSFASVLIGSGHGSLPLRRALRGFVHGVADALQRLPQKERLKSVVLVEHDAARYEQMLSELEGMRKEHAGGALDLRVTKQVMGRAARRGPGKPRPADLLSAPTPELRISAERVGDLFHFSALTEGAIVPSREVDLEATWVSMISDRLMAARERAEQLKYGELLYSYLIPPDFSELIGRGLPITLTLDADCAAFCWEMASYTSPGGPCILGIEQQLTRQFRTLSSQPGILPAPDDPLKVLIIADPSDEPELHLPAARVEGQRVARLFEYFRAQEAGVVIHSRIGPEECDPVEILSLLSSESFDIIHFTGHGFVDEDDPAQSGIGFGKSLILSVREMFRAHRVPRLFFANTALPMASTTLRVPNLQKAQATLARACLAAGAQNFVGAGWHVNETAALNFPLEFYRQILAGETLGRATAAARRFIYDHDFSSAWGAYQHYGQGNTLLIRSNAK